MREQYVATIVRAVAVAAVVLCPAAAQAQGGSTAPAAPPQRAAYTAPKTPWGKPDLQGTFSNRTITPFERPANVNGREFFTPEEVAALEKRASEQSGDEERNVGTRGDVERAYNDFWWDRGTKVTTLRTSLVVDPPDGRVPALTEEARRRQADEAKRPAYRSAGAAGSRGTDSWLDRSLFERCITRGMPGAMSPTAYNNNYRITQAPGVVAIEIEMLGGTRIIPTDGRSHLNPSIRQWHGNSVGRWEGNTLVVETMNFRAESAPQGGSENVRMIERFTPTSAGTLEWSVTFDDPSVWTRPWTYSMPLTRVDQSQQLFEYACHEGNHAMRNILSAARAAESK
jgi:hypothetical protein